MMIKKINELGVSPRPWSTYKTKRQVTVLASCSPGEDIDVCECRGPRQDANARLIAAAPELYECLREAVMYHCGEDPMADCENKCYGNPACLSAGTTCMVEKWRKALAKAAGEAK